MPLNINIQQILLHMFNFVLLFGILYFLLYKPVKDFMEKRKQEYEECDKRAHDDMKDAAALKADYEKRLADADEEIVRMRAESVQNAEAEREKIIESANEKADAIVEKARKKAEGEADMVKAQAQSELADYVAKMAQKLVMESDDSQGFDSFFEAAGEKATSEEA